MIIVTSIDPQRITQPSLIVAGMWNYMGVEAEVFPHIFKMGASYKMTWKNFGNLALE